MDVPTKSQAKAEEKVLIIHGFRFLVILSDQIDVEYNNRAAEIKIIAIINIVVLL